MSSTVVVRLEFEKDNVCKEEVYEYLEDLIFNDQLGYDHNINSPALMPTDLSNDWNTWKP